MPEPQLYAAGQSFFGLTRETTKGTAQAASVFLPYKNPQQTPQQQWIDDEGMRGSPVRLYDSVLGLRNDLMEFDGDAHLDTFPHLLMAALGGTDTVTGAGPYVHTIPLFNSAAVASQPPGYSLTDFNGYQALQMAGAQLDSLEIDFTLKDSFQYKAKFAGQPFTVVSTPTGATYSGVDKVVPSWSNAVQIGGVASAILVDGSITLARNTQPVWTAGQQNPVVTFADKLDVTGKLTLLVAGTDAVQPAGLTYQQQALTLTFTDPSSSHTCLLQMSKVQFTDPKISRGQAWDQIDVTLKIVANTTDASTGYSPIKAVVTNAQSASY